MSNLGGYNYVTKRLASDGSLVGNYKLPGSSHAIAFDGTNIWVANSSNDSTVTKLLASTGAIVGTYQVGGALSGHYGIAFDGTSIWVANYNGTPSGNTVSKMPAF